jgi:hypothetical protein
LPGNTGKSADTLRLRAYTAQFLRLAHRKRRSKQPLSHSSASVYTLQISSSTFRHDRENTVEFARSFR